MAERVAGLWTDVWLDGAEVSAKLDPYLTSLRYSDNLEGNAPDKIEVCLEDSAGLFHGRFYPKKGASLHFEFGFDKPGREIAFKSARGFEIDEIKFGGPPDKVTWTATGQKPSGKIHTQKSRSWENTSFEGIASAIAKEHGTGLVFDAGRPIPLRHLPQVKESDLMLLKRLAKTYGLSFSLKGGAGSLTLVIIGNSQRLKGAAVYEICRESLTSFSFDDKTAVGTKGARSQYFDADKKKLIELAVPGTDADGHEIRTVSVREATEAHLEGALDSAKAYGASGDLSLPGNPRLLAGAMVNLSGWGRYDGNWLVVESEHSLDVSSGYKTGIKIKRKQ
jgi:phage protein D